ncbi:alpha/beta hydrolase [Clostridium sp. WLY-B-L2]|uniref:Alpha/beta hydrolase n=1 Tax=Clostridium aromativorans TaxID=2836848 RepID=A0ABS8N109_9CLOT|nr:alpha/beta hydrolase [Clostridium aromativorans]MCC9293477.1 alpha/beta hydrolase [Clostridium aromativorans]
MKSKETHFFTRQQEWESLFLLIAGGGGDGDLYLPLADELANQYKVITYDRRANARSTMNFPDHFDISQQAKDALAVLKAAGESSAIVFGNSSGAVIAIEMERLFPGNVLGVIVHEPPMARLHPESNKWRIFFTARNFGKNAVADTKDMDLDSSIPYT